MLGASGTLLCSAHGGFSAYLAPRHEDWFAGFCIIFLTDLCDGDFPFLAERQIIRQITDALRIEIPG
jgi:hypothetical protein